MTKHRRYQLTEQQLKPVIRAIKEGYEDRGEDFYNRVVGVSFDSEQYELVFDVETDQRHVLTKRVDIATDPMIQRIETALAAENYNLSDEPEWEVIDAQIREQYLVIVVSPMGEKETYQPKFDLREVIEWLPEMSWEERYPINEPDPDEYYERQRERHWDLEHGNA